MGIIDKIKALFFDSKAEDIVPDRHISTKQDKPNPEIKSTPSNTNISWNNNADLSPHVTPQTEPTLQDKAKDFIVETGNEVVSQGSAVWDAVKDKMEIIEEKAKPYIDKAKEKANESAEKVKEFIDEKLEDAKKMEAEEAKMDADKDGFADKPIEFGKSVSDSHDSFFNKAEEWLKKQEAKDAANTPNEDNNKNNKIERLELPKED